jgi:hypothetical protein
VYFFEENTLGHPETNAGNSGADGSNDDRNAIEEIDVLGVRRKELF